MRLFDRIFSQAGKRADPRLMTTARAIAATPARYTLDPMVSDTCVDLVRSGSDMFAPGNGILRMPLTSFWLEFFAEEDECEDGAQDPRERCGLYVECEADGRRGTINQIWGAADGSVLPVPGTLLFDLDGELSAPAESRTTFSLVHADLPHLDALLKHALLTLPDPNSGPGWSQNAFRDRSAIASSMWFALPIVLAFSAMLASPAVVRQSRSDLGRLNAARVKRGRAPLLDHVDVTMVLGDRNVTIGGTGSAARRPPRLHFVRGHFMHRSGRAIWRSAHLRGAPDGPVRTRNVLVRMSGQQKARA